MQDWLNERRESFLNEGRTLFELFKKEFNLSTGDARRIIHSWDADVRGIKPGRPRIEES